MRHDVRHRRTNVAQTLPWAFLQETIRHIKRRTTPALNTEQLVHFGSICRCYIDHVDRTHTGRQQRLVPVTHRCIRDQQLRLIAHPVGHSFWALLVQNLAGAVSNISGWFHWRFRQLHLSQRLGTANCFRVPVHRNIGNICQQFRRAVTACFEIKQASCLVDEFGVVFIVQEDRVLQQVFHKRNVGRYTANTELAQRTVHACNRHFRCGGACRHFGQQAVVKTSDHRARISSTTIKTDARTGGRTIHLDATVIRDKVVLRIFSCHAALQSVAIQLNICLGRTACGLSQ